MTVAAATLVTLLALLAHSAAYLLIARQRGRRPGWLELIPFVACLTDDGSRGVSRARRLAALGAATAANYVVIALFVAGVVHSAGDSTGTAYWTVAGFVPTSDARGKLETGDRIISVSGQPVYAMVDHQFARPSLLDLARGKTGQAVAMTVERDGARHSLRITVQRFERSRGESYEGFGISVKPQPAPAAPVGLTRALGRGLVHPIRYARRLVGSLADTATEPEEGVLRGPVGITDTIRGSVEPNWTTAFRSATRLGTQQLLLFVLIGLALVIRVWMAPARA